MRLLPALVALLVLFTAPGCAGVRVVEGPTSAGADRPEGFLFYEAKPYLLVTKVDENKTSAEIISLPDLGQPRYLQHDRGLGSHTFSFELSNGILTKFGQTSAPPGAADVKSLADALAVALPGAAFADDSFEFALYEIELVDGGGRQTLRLNKVDVQL